MRAWEPRALDLLADPELVYVNKNLGAQLEKDLIYYRLHGSPEIYKSNYSDDFISKVQSRLQEAQQSGKKAWCIFDNTTFGYATQNALKLRGDLLMSRGPERKSSPGKKSQAQP